MVSASFPDSFIAALLTAIQAISGYAAPTTLPEIVFLPPAMLEQRACVGPCQVYGWFPPGETIYLRSDIDPLNDLWARSILVHEIVHYFQQENISTRPRSKKIFHRHASESLTPCQLWLNREYEAFTIQLIWYRQSIAADQTIQHKALKQPLWGRLCR